jgi:hypothetical protein
MKVGLMAEDQQNGNDEPQAGVAAPSQYSPLLRRIQRQGK